MIATEPTTNTVAVPGATMTYDIRPAAAGTSEPPLLLIGSPMGASGFEQLVSHFGDRTVITYDPRGMERSTRTPGGKLTAETHAEDYHRVIAAVGLGPVDAFGSSGGGMCALHWVVAHPGDVHTLVSLEQGHQWGLVGDERVDVLRVSDDPVQGAHPAPA